MNWGIVYYTDNRCEERIASIVRKQLRKICDGHEIISVSQYPINFGKNIVVNLPRNSVSIIKQIYEGLEASTAEIVFLCEHDVLYHENHFKVDMKNERKFYYDVNLWQVDSFSGHCLFRIRRCTSMCVAYRENLLQHFGELLEIIQKRRFSKRKMGFAPGIHHIKGITYFGMRDYYSEYPSIDIRHSMNFIPTRFKKEHFTHAHSVFKWEESDSLPFWGKIEGCFDTFLMQIDRGLK